jgi:hypothetical protein
VSAIRLDAPLLRRCRLLHLQRVGADDSSSAFRELLILKLPARRLADAREHRKCLSEGRMQASHLICNSLAPNLLRFSTQFTNDTVFALCTSTAGSKAVKHRYLSDGHGASSGPLGRIKLPALMQQSSLPQERRGGKRVGCAKLCLEY